MAYGKNKKAPQREITPPALIAWHVSERGENKFWNRIGAAWEHKDDPVRTSNDTSPRVTRDIWGDLCDRLFHEFVGRSFIKRSDPSRGLRRDRNVVMILQCKKSANGCPQATRA